MNNDKSYEYPNNLYVLPEDWMAKCEAEDDNDIRHIGRYLTFLYICPNCGPQRVQLTPDYPYCGANSVWTCCHCYSVMTLNSPIPIAGTPKKCMTTYIRKSY